MAFLIVYELSAGVPEEQRLSLRADHRAYVASHVGGLVRQVSRMFTPNGSELRGGYVLLDTDDLDEARAFSAHDPYVSGGIWAPKVFGSVEIGEPDRAPK